MGLYVAGNVSRVLLPFIISPFFLPTVCVNKSTGRRPHRRASLALVAQFEF